MSEHKTIALVTGASSGLGEEFCRQLAGRCDVIIAVARRGERLRALQQELANLAEVHVVEADLLTVEGVAHTMEMLRQKGPVDILVNKTLIARGEVVVEKEKYGIRIKEIVSRRERLNSLR